MAPHWVRRFIRLVGADALANLTTRLVPSLAGDAAFFARLAMRILERNAILMVSPRLAEDGVKLVGLPLLADPARAVGMAEKMLGSGPKRVIVFPAGGVSYPILSPR